MKDRRPARRLDHSEGEDPTRSAAYPFLLSLGLHLLVIGALVYIPMSFSPPRRLPGAISVSLLSLPGPGPGAGAGDGGPKVEKPKPAEAPKPVETPKPPPEKPAVPIAEPAPKPVPATPKPEVSLAPPKLKEKKSLKEQTKNPEKMIEQAIDRIEKKVKEPDSASVTAAIDRIRKKLGEAEATQPRPGPPGAAAPGPGPAGGGGGGGGGGTGQFEPINIYRAEIAYQVEKNWAFSPQLAGSDKKLQVGLVFKVLPNGQITDIQYTERSNNAYLDESAYRAIAKSSPVKPHPQAIKMPYVQMALRFTPEGIR
jgi:colicin import membrane protein